MSVTGNPPVLSPAAMAADQRRTAIALVCAYRKSPDDFGRLLTGRTGPDDLIDLLVSVCGLAAEGLSDRWLDERLQEINRQEASGELEDITRQALKEYRARKWNRENGHK